MTEPITDTKPAAPTLSADGRWWWDGKQWLSTLSEDGLWRWDGAEWKAAVPIEATDPEALVEVLDRHVDAAFAEAGQILALRAHEWRRSDPAQEELVAQAAPLAARLASVDAQLAGIDSGARPSIMSLLGRDEREQLEIEARRIEAELHPVAAAIGRMAPVPSIRDADEILGPTRRLNERLLDLSEAVRELRERRLAREEAIESARQALEEANAERERRLAELESAGRQREAEHAQAVEELTLALRRVRIPGPGEARANFGELVVYENRVDTPDGRALVADATALVGTAEELAAEHPDLVSHLWLMESAHAAELNDALAHKSPARFLLVRSPGVSSIVPLPAGEEREAAAFMGALEEAATAAREGRTAWKRQVRAAEAALESALADTSAVDEARAALERAQDDPELWAPVRKAEARLAKAEAGGPEDEAIRARIARLVDRLLEPPAKR
ncbi:MAG TPA: hypothetical protein VF134_08365 [Candidatus Dormibacteraeota bacterium]